MKLQLTILLGVALAAPFSCYAEDSVAVKIEKTSVSIQCLTSHGSGTIVKRGDSVFVLTAWHVVKSNRMGKMGFIPLIVVRYENDGRGAVKTISYTGDVVRYSEAHDIALIHLRDCKGEFGQTPKFYEGASFHEIGSDVYMMGSALGVAGYNSLFKGIVSYNGRIYESQYYSQGDFAGYSGCSGGGVFDKEGRYIGMMDKVVLHPGGDHAEGLSLYVPIQRLRSWADESGLSWLFNESEEVPPLEKILEGKNK